MGKQMRFFLNQNDINNFYIFLKEQDSFIINEDGTALEDYDIQRLQDYEYMRNKFKHCSFFITYQNAKINYRYYSSIDRKCLSSMDSEVIEFSFSFPKDKKYEVGRVWFSEKYYDDKGNIFEKSSTLSDLYNKIYRYIRKNYRLSTDKFAYIAENAYKEYLTDNFIPCQFETIIEFDK